MHLLLFGPTRELSKRPDDTRSMLKLVALFKSNWDRHDNDSRGDDSGGDDSAGGDSDSDSDSDNGVVGEGDQGGGIFYDQDGNIIQDVFGGGGGDVINGHEWGKKERRRRHWGKEVLFWLNRAVRKQHNWRIWLTSSIIFRGKAYFLERHFVQCHMGSTFEYSRNELEDIDVCLHTSPVLDVDAP